MDVEALILLSHMKVRLERLTRNPSLIESFPPMAIAPPKLPAPIQLAGLKSRLTRGANLEARAGAVGTRVDAAHDVIEAGVAALEQYAPGLEQYGGDLLNQIQRLSEPTNGGPPEDGSEVPAVVDPNAPRPGPNGGPRIL